jgi:tetratricopeptide (TPR) repeat protein
MARDKPGGPAMPSAALVCLACRRFDLLSASPLSAFVYCVNFQEGTVADTPTGNREIPEADRKRAEAFFDRARTIADTGNYEYAIEMYLQGLNWDPENIEIHQKVRELAMIRKVNGGKPLGMFSKPKPTKDDKLNMLNAEKVLAYDPSSGEAMSAMMSAAFKAGCYDTCLWAGQLLFNLNVGAKQPSFERYIKIKDTFKAIGRFQEALDVMAYAKRMKPSDMDLDHEMKNLAAESTIKKARYAEEGGFQQSVKDKDAQKALMEKDTGIATRDNLEKWVIEAEREYKVDPSDISRFSKFVDALKRTEMPQYENQAIELLENRYRDTKQYKFQASANLIRIAQMGRRERTLREAFAASPTDVETKKRLATFLREKTEEELRIYTETVQNYPNDIAARFEMGRRLFMLRRFEEAIDVLQQVRMDPKFKMQATVMLGRAFLEAGFVDEAADTLLEAVQSYQVRGDETSIEINYYCATALEAKGDIPAALKMYSQVAQWKFTYRDVQQRIKRLRAGNQPQASTATPQS